MYTVIVAQTVIKQKTRTAKGGNRRRLSRYISTGGTMSYLHWNMSQAGNRRLVLTAVVIAVIVAVAIVSLIQHDPSSAVHVPAWHQRVRGLHGH
jgi:hypothetical protein